MKFRFVGKYTGDRNSITMNGPEVNGVRPSATFTENEPTEVDDDDLCRRLSNNPDFKEVHGRKGKHETEA